MTHGEYEHFREVLNEREKLLGDYLLSLPEQHHAEAQKVRSLLTEIHGALDRIEHHSYGRCKVCKDDVEFYRLEVQPIREVCLGCITPEEQAALEEELALASKIHRALLPQKIEVIEGFDVAVKAMAARTIGGDFYDFIRSEHDDSVKVIIADTMGKGLPAGLLMSNFQGALRILAQEIDSPSLLVAKLNRWLVRNVPITKFVSLACVVIQPGKSGDSLARFTNAGHCPMVLVRANGATEKLCETGGVIGVHEDFSFDEQTVVLHPGDTILLYTDGVTEAINARDDMFGEERLLAFASAHASQSAGALVDHLVRDVETFTGKNWLDDDLTIIAVQRKAE